MKTHLDKCTEYFENKEMLRLILKFISLYLSIVNEENIDDVINTIKELYLRIKENYGNG